LVVPQKENPFAEVSTRVLVSARYRLRESGVNPELSRSGKQERTP